MANSFLVKHINILDADEKELSRISEKYLLSLNLLEMKAIQRYFRSINRQPTDCELEVLAQTWSEHCKHKTLTGPLEYRWQKAPGVWRKKIYHNLLKETIFKVTEELNKKWCLSVFKDNAGIIEFDDKYAVAFKVETHNHPSAIEPYGGAGTGVGGVIRDILGCGLGAKPIMNTDVFCFGNIDTDYRDIPEGVLHPKRIFRGVVSGVRDYGNRMGIPTASGAIIFAAGYLYNPLVYCGTVGIMPRDKIFKTVEPGDRIVLVGGRTGRDGIHGATFSSLSLKKDIEATVVQIGNPVVEKKLVDTLLKARDENLYRAITDCGAGGLSSAIGELAIFSNGAKVYLEKVPLKYKGLLPWEIFLSESQERMVLAVPEKNIKRILEIFSAEDVEATVIGEFVNTAKLEVFYEKELICCLDIDFLHRGLPKLKKIAVWKKPKTPTIKISDIENVQAELLRLLASPNICSREWVIRQYDFEVQANTVIKPLTGRSNDGPADAAVIKPLPDSFKGLAVACGIKPEYGQIDPYRMAASCIDEAIRNVICVGGDFRRIALLDNFCWGSSNDREQLGGLVRACQACFEIAKVLETPFISGKDSLNNEYKLGKKSVSIPKTLLISAIAIVPDVRKCLTPGLKKVGNPIYVLGLTRDIYPPDVEPKKAKKLFLSLTEAIEKRTIVSCHDCSEGGLGVCLSEMAFSGELGVVFDLRKVPYRGRLRDGSILFAESNSRFVVEVDRKYEQKFLKIMKGNVFSKIGYVQKTPRLVVFGLSGKKVIDADIFQLKSCWQKTLKDL